MPTGLTGDIYEGKNMSLRKFALGCAAQFSAGYMATNFGEEDLPLYAAPTIPYDDYYVERLKEAKRKVAYWLDIDANEDSGLAKYQEFLDEWYRSNESYKKKNDDLLARYQEMLKKVESWEMEEKYEDLKKLMIKQLKESIEFDCPEDKPIYNEEPPTYKEWVRGKICNACEDVKYYTEQIEKNKKNVDELNEWLKGLYEAIDEVEPVNKV